MKDGEKESALLIGLAMPKGVGKKVEKESEAPEGADVMAEFAEALASEDHAGMWKAFKVAVMMCNEEYED